MSESVTRFDFWGGELRHLTASDASSKTERDHAFRQLLHSKRLWRAAHGRMICGIHSIRKRATTKKIAGAEHFSAQQPPSVAFESASRAPRNRAHNLLSFLVAKIIHSPS
jgi:hypothetical protein